MEERIINILKTSNNYVSGEHLSNELNVSRTSVWKYIKKLKSKGYKIEGISNKGYKLIQSPDKLTEVELQPLLKTHKIGRTIYHFDNIDSTNIKAKELAKSSVPDGSIIIAEEQTLGSGRFNRKWFSPNGGIWFSLLLKPSVPPSDAPKITQIAGAAVYKTLESLNIPSTIKWPNDILINNKKVCGILAEMKCDMEAVHYLILGIGINVNLDKSDFDDSIKETATSLKIEYNKQFSKKHLLADFLFNFENLYNDFLNKLDLSKTVEICRQHSNIWNKKAKLITYNKEEIVTCISLSDTGDLIVRDENGIEKAVLSGEISFKSLT
ncbi:biotin--[acetyl-CoA-carboxylase] ligase [Clostridium sp. SM-530-WT-3G]|uniref:biotin--[acetyl-CoA-carboxylase] ligase n=1 Tax=Clostridium sp. SM-530-WT-3G TaxID=2725303 RepID=UPI00145D5311|nr:biotin--[acetyl-CoA-carboxylase] ligase [Clostridium sp. SM-530-WT-3G]NME82425.1 biotin--[acetyl-CoA-carboxylase] ligase [Clostridium sp. SM-530-WT-3G]